MDKMAKGLLIIMLLLITFNSAVMSAHHAYTSIL